MADSTVTLASLRGLRTAPALGELELKQLQQELRSALASSEWFTVGVMASSAEAAVAALRSKVSSVSPT